MFVRPVILTVVYAVIVSQNLACCHGCHGASSKSLSAIRDGNKAHGKKIVSESLKYRSGTDKPVVASTKQLSKVRGVPEEDEGRYSDEKDDQQIMREMRLQRARDMADYRTGSRKDRVGSEKNRFEKPSSGAEKKLAQSTNEGSHNFDSGEYSNFGRTQTGLEKQRVGADRTQFETTSSGADKKLAQTTNRNSYNFESSEYSNFGRTQTGSEKQRVGSERNQFETSIRDHGKYSGEDYTRTGYTKSRKEEDELDRLIGNDEVYRLSDSKRVGDVKGGRDSKFCLENDYYERIAPGVKQVILGEPKEEINNGRDFEDLDSLKDRKVKYYDSESVRDYNNKKMKALDSFEVRDIEKNRLGDSSPKIKTDDHDLKNHVDESDIDHEFDSQSAEEVLQNILDNDKQLEDTIQERKHSENFNARGETKKEDSVTKNRSENFLGSKTPARSEKNYLSEKGQNSNGEQKSGIGNREAGDFSDRPENQKSKSDVLGEYKDVLGKIEELYKLLNTPVASGAEKLENPELYAKNGNLVESENRQNYHVAEYEKERDQIQKFVGEVRNVEKSSYPEYTNQKQRQDTATPKYSSLGSEEYYSKQDFKTQERYQNGAKFNSENSEAGRSFDDSNHLGYRSGNNRESENSGRYSSEPKPDHSVGAGRLFDDTKYPEYRSDKDRQSGMSGGYKDGYKSDYPVGAGRSFDDTKYPEYRSENDRQSGISGGYKDGYKSDYPVGGGRSFDDTKYPEYRLDKDRQSGISGRYIDGYTDHPVEKSFDYPTYPDRKPGRNYPEYFDGQSSSKRAQEERNLNSPKCKFENLNPSREMVSEEEERNLQFRSQGNKQVGRSKFVGQSKKAAAVDDVTDEIIDLDEEIPFNNNRETKEFQSRKNSQVNLPSNNNYDVKQSVLEHEPNYRGSSVGPDPYMNQKDAFSVGSSKKIGSRKPVVGSKYTEKPHFDEQDKKVGTARSKLGTEKTYDYYKKVGNPSRYDEKPAKALDRNGLSESDFLASRNQGQLGKSVTANNEDFDDNFRDMMVNQLGQKAPNSRKTLGNSNSNPNRVSANRQQEKTVQAKQSGFPDLFGNEGYDDREMQLDYDDDKINERSSGTQHHDVTSRAHSNSHLTSGHHQQVTAGRLRGHSGMIDESELGTELDPIEQEIKKSTKPEVSQLPVGTTTHLGGENQFQDLKSLQGEEKDSPGGGLGSLVGGESPGCNSIFRCLAKVGQTLIEPLTGPEGKSEPKAEEAEQDVQQNSARSADGTSGAAGHAHVHPHGGHASGRASELGGNAGEATGTGSKGPLGFLHLDDHPFYGLVTSIIEAAQEATKQRLLEEKHAKLQYRPPKVSKSPQSPVLSSTGNGNTSVVGQTQSQSQDVNTIPSPASSNGQLSIAGETKAISSPEMSKNVQGSEKKVTAKQNPSTGSEKKFTGSAKNAALSSRKIEPLAKYSVSEARKNTAKQVASSGFGKKQAEIIGRARKFNTGSSKKVNTGSEKQKVTASLKKSNSKVGDVRGKLGSYKKVNFETVGAKKLGNSKPETSKTGKTLTSSDKKVDSKVTGAVKLSQKASSTPLTRPISSSVSVSRKADAKVAPSKTSDATSVASSKTTS